MAIKITPLGAGQHVGKSAILVEFTDQNVRVLLDCGMQVSVAEDRKYPDFSGILSKKNSLNASNASPKSPQQVHLDAVLISHFHLDHVGALPHLTGVLGYLGPVIMTAPTKAVALAMLEDSLNLARGRPYVKGSSPNSSKRNSSKITSEMLHACFSRVQTISLHATLEVTEQLSVTAYYAGHVLGAVMFHIVCGKESVVYTGDYNMTPDRHLGAAWISKCRPDVLITESTYATTIRSSKRTREKDFLDKILSCVTNGGKILIPVFALGRAQELCILIEALWEKMQLDVPVYFSGALMERSTKYFRMFVGWTNQRIKRAAGGNAGNLFNFKHIRAFRREYSMQEGPMVLFATPGMLAAGFSMEMFSLWAPDPRNMVILPGYCSQGTVGARLLQGDRELTVFNQKLTVRLAVENMSFSAHTDAIGILQLVQMVCPSHVVLVHGEASRMPFLADKVKRLFNLDCYYPKNNETLLLPTRLLAIEVQVSTELVNAYNTRMLEALASVANPDPCSRNAATAYESVLLNEIRSLVSRAPGDKNQALSFPVEIAKNTNKNCYKVDLKEPSQHGDGSDDIELKPFGLTSVIRIAIPSNKTSQLSWEIFRLKTLAGLKSMPELKEVLLLDASAPNNNIQNLSSPNMQASSAIRITYTQGIEAAIAFAHHRFEAAMQVFGILSKFIRPSG